MFMNPGIQALVAAMPIIIAAVLLVGLRWPASWMSKLETGIDSSINRKKMSGILAWTPYVLVALIPEDSLKQ